MSEPKLDEAIDAFRRGDGAVMNELRRDVITWLEELRDIKRLVGRNTLDEIERIRKRKKWEKR